jgi:hypothetical protein
MIVIQDYSFTRLKAIVSKNVNNVNTFQYKKTVNKNTTYLRDYLNIFNCNFLGSFQLMSLLICAESIEVNQKKNKK